MPRPSTSKAAAPSMPRRCRGPSPLQSVAVTALLHRGLRSAAPLSGHSPSRAPSSTKPASCSAAILRERAVLSSRTDSSAKCSMYPESAHQPLDGEPERESGVLLSNERPQVFDDESERESGALLSNKVRPLIARWRIIKRAMLSFTDQSFDEILRRRRANQTARWNAEMNIDGALCKYHKKRDHSKERESLTKSH
uniref:Uncharacterized protein n=1 Tax=Ananas comosus var. bracteatus TaxID=296719 RepID=A0A6V7NPB7_ANACO|nr:unnamed protein product [Ananas comosus var. bracteatus]